MAEFYFLPTGLKFEANLTHNICTFTLDQESSFMKPLICRPETNEKLVNGKDQ